ncbi:MAG: sugar ABC transporter ATP-binding protein [Burkholderiales bacterium]|nr:sugar ABC transporter ATP-binding protein [Anaerolineae bacterium]
MNESSIIELKNISKRFLGLQALDHVDFDLREGETHALVGENGAGKSTLMKILSGVYNEYEGEYLLRGQPVHLHSPRNALDRGIGMIHQELSVMAELSVAENLFLGRQPLNRWGAVDWKRMNATAEEELAKLGFPDINVQHPLGEYPLGTQQVVEVLRVMLSGAQVLIMDEPTSALSPAEVERLISLIDTLRQTNRSIIYISHFLDEVLRVADRITVLRDGRKITTVEQKNTNVDELISLILGRELKTATISAPTKPGGSTLLDVSSLTADVFRDISLTVGQGEIVGVYGAIGAGHFDLARAIFGMYTYDSGAITVDGRRFPKNFSATYAIKHGIAYATESRRKSLLMDEAIFRNVTMPHLNRMGAMAPNLKREVEIAQPAVERVNVQPPNAMNTVGKLSGGNQQKVVIARWLAFPPKVFVMSEPTRGMDVGAKREVMNILREFRSQGYGVLVVSSEPETVLDVCDRIMVMSRGNVVAEMANENLNKDILMRLL